MSNFLHQCRCHCGKKGFHKGLCEDHLYDSLTLSAQEIEESRFDPLIEFSFIERVSELIERELLNSLRCIKFGEVVG